MKWLLFISGIFIVSSCQKYFIDADFSAYQSVEINPLGYYQQDQILYLKMRVEYPSIKTSRSQLGFLKMIALPPQRLSSKTINLRSGYLDSFYFNIPEPVQYIPRQLLKTEADLKRGFKKLFREYWDDSMHIDQCNNITKTCNVGYFKLNVEDLNDRPIHIRLDFVDIRGKILVTSCASTYKKLVVFDGYGFCSRGSLIPSYFYGKSSFKRHSISHLFIPLELLWSKTEEERDE